MGGGAPSRASGGDAAARPVGDGGRPCRDESRRRDRDGDVARSLIPLAVGTALTDLFGAIALATAGGTVFGTLGAMVVVPALLVGRRAKRGSAVQEPGAISR